MNINTAQFLLFSFPLKTSQFRLSSGDYSCRAENSEGRSTSPKISLSVKCKYWLFVYLFLYFFLHFFACFFPTSTSCKISLSVKCASIAALFRYMCNTLFTNSLFHIKDYTRSYKIIVAKIFFKLKMCNSQFTNSTLPWSGALHKYTSPFILMINKIRDFFIVVHFCWCRIFSASADSNEMQDFMHIIEYG